MKYNQAIFVLVLLLLGIRANAQNTWYTLASGDWDNQDIWTLDPAGAVPVGSAVPSAGDNVVILTGKTVVVPDGNAPYDEANNGGTARVETLNLGKVKVIGQLDLRQSGGHTFTELSGSGRILMAADNYPAIGDDSGFVNKDGDQGTCVYYGNSNFNIQSATNFYNLEIDMNTGNQVTLRENYVLNGNFLVKSGRVRLGENSAIRYSITVNGDINIQADGELTVRSGQSFGDSESDYHQVICYGNFTNNGKVDLTTQSNPVYNIRLTGDGVAAAVLTMTGTSDANFTCNGTTDLYRLIINKGNDQSYTVNLSASNEANFRLFGCNNQSGANTKALYLQNGTLKLSGAVFIPTLTEGGSDFSIGASAALHLNGGGVKVYSTARTNAETTVGGVTGSGVNTANSGSQSFSVYGKFMVTDGLFETKSHGFVAWDSGSAIVHIEGGTVITPGFRSAGGQTGKWSYNQSGGLVQLYGDINSDLSGSNSPTFHVKGTDNVFIMSGGVMEIYDAATGSNLALGIESGEGNYSVTGGTIRINRTNTGGNYGSLFNISSTVPLYNLELSSSNTQNVILTSALTVLNNLTLTNANSTITTSNYTLEIGGDFSNGGTFSTGSSHTTRFIGGNPSGVDGGTIVFDDIELAKDDPTNTLTLGSGTVSIMGNLTIAKGTLDIGTSDRNLAGNIDITYGDITGTNALVLNGTSQQTLKGKTGQNSVFGNLRLDNGSGSPQIKILSNIDVESLYLVRNQIVDIGTYNLEVKTSLSKAGSVVWGYNQSMFRTSGLSSDGGLTLPIVLSGNYNDVSVQFFPIGLYDSGNSPNDRYTPVEVFGNGTSLSATGSLTAKPITGKHPTTDPTASVLPFYWSVNYSGLEGITKDNLRYSFTYDKDLANWFEKNGSVLTDRTWAEFTGVRQNGNRTYSFPYAAEFTKDFTLGKSNDYNWVRTLYSRQNGSWSDSNTWSETSHTGGALSWWDGPRNGDRIVIGNNHRINVAYDGTGTYTDITVGELIFDHDTIVSKYFEDLPRLQIERGNKMNLNRVSGTGMLTQWIDNNRDPIITGDLGAFSNEKYSWFLYVGVAASVNAPTYPEIYPNVAFEGQKVTFTNDIEVNYNVNPRGNSTLLLNNGTNGDIAIGGDLIVGQYQDGAVEFPAGNNNRTLTVEGNLDFTSFAGTTPTSARSIYVSNASGNAEHRLVVNGDIMQGVGVIDLFNLAGRPTVTLVFEGANNSSVLRSGSGRTEFSKIEVNKPTGKKVEFTQSFLLSGDKTGAVKALTLTSGECHLNNTAINIDLSTGGNDFKIPSGTILNVDGATVNVGGNASNTGIWLDGSLIINNSGIVNCNQGSGAYIDNYIEYSTSGNGSVWLGDGAELHVGSQIRRSISTDVGALTFSQNHANSTVTIGTQTSGNSTRGIFEILGTNSSFTQVAGANITLVRGHGATKAALFFDPQTVSIGQGAGFTIGNNLTPAGQTMAIYAGKEIGNLTVEGTNAPTAVLNIVPATLNGNLTINSGTFNANGLDLVLKGNFTKNTSAVFTANNNTTYFEGLTDQTISGTPIFANLVKQLGTGSLIQGASSPITVTGDLGLYSGTLNTGENDLTVQGNVTNNIITLGSGSTQGIVMAGSDVQQLGGNGTFYRLTINNANGVVLPTQSGAITFTDYLKLQDGVFDIGRNLLVIEEAAGIVGNGTGTPFSETNMIQTNLSFVDNGIKKFFPEISSGTSTFTYPIGSLGKYTPVVFDITEKNATRGSIRVKAADEPHVSVPVADQDEVLQYNWTLDAEGIEGLVANTYMYFYESDAVGYGDTATYQAARILLSGIDWYKLGVDDFHGGAGNNYINFRLGSTGSGTNDDGIDGDYTAGAKIPDQVPAFISVVDDNWNNQSTWATYNPATGVTGVAGVGVPAGGPRGAVVYIDNNVSMPNNFMAAYRTYINTIGTVDVGTSFGHRLGDVFGTGTLKVMSGDLPAGSYDDFFSATGGILEYAGSADYDILSEITSLNHLVLSGTGERRLPNIDFQILGDLSLNGADVVNTHNRNMSIKGDIAFTGGSFDAGTTFGARIPTLTMNGDILQSISGTQHFTSTNALYNFEINCAVGVKIENDIEVDNILNLAKGIVYTDAGGSLTIMNSTAAAFQGGSNTAYVQGALRKNIVGGDNFTFPLGDVTRYGEITVSPNASSSGIWSARYYNSNPANGGMSPDALVAPVEYVSHNEYWNVQAPGVGLKANVLLRWDANSGINPNNDFRVVKWTAGTPDAWDQLLIGSKVGDSSAGTVNLSSDLTFGFNGTANHYFTFGSVLIPAFQWEGGISGDWFNPNNWSGTSVPGAGTDITVNNTGVAPYISNTSVAQVHNLTINHTGGLTLQPGSQMTINGNLVTNDKLFIENTNASPASLITHGTVTGNVSIQWVYDELRWWFIGHSISNPQMDSYRNIPISDPGNKYVLYDYEDPGTLIKISDNSLYNFSANDELRGYQLKVLKPGTGVNHSGPLNNSAVYEKAVQTGWQIIANPYASYYQLPTDPAGSGDFSKTAGSVYVTVSTSNKDKVYETFNTNSGISSPGTFNGIIAPSQAFYIKTIESSTPGDKLYMRASNRVHDSNKSSLKSVYSSESNLLRVKISNEYDLTDEAVIALRADGDTSITRRDSEQRFMSGTDISYIYSIVGGIKTVINVLPQELNTYQQPLGVQLKEGKQEIKIEGLDQLLYNYDIVLEDKVAGVLMPMTSQVSYEFTGEAGTFDDRFVLHFNKIQVPTGTNDLEIGESDVNVYIQDKSTLQVICNWDAKEKTVSIFTITGQEVLNQTFEGETLTEHLTLKTGVYIVQISGAGKTYEQKVFVR